MSKPSMTVQVEMIILQATSLGYSLMPWISDIFCSLGGSETSIVDDDVVSLGWAWLGVMPSHVFEDHKVVD